MDNLAHTLLGAAIGEAGLKKKTGLGMATLMIAANLPDLDVLGLFMGENLAWRRGWTHGPIALVILPLLLALAVVGFDRWQARRGKRPADRVPVRFGWVVALAYVGILSHPLLDFLNSYGIRCLMPFSDRWFYGDALFIIDIWMWSALGIGIWIARRRGRLGRPDAEARRPAIVAIVAVAAYAGAMGVGSLIAERIVAREVIAQGLGTPRVVVASPVPVDPLRRDIVFATGGSGRAYDALGFGELRWLPAARLTLPARLMPTRMDDPAIAEAARTDKAVADFLYWSRLPFAAVERQGGEARVTIGDARYNRAPDGRFSVTATVPE